MWGAHSSSSCHHHRHLWPIPHFVSAIWTLVSEWIPPAGHQGLAWGLFWCLGGHQHCQTHWWFWLKSQGEPSFVYHSPAQELLFTQWLKNSPGGPGSINVLNYWQQKYGFLQSCSFANVSLWLNTSLKYCSKQKLHWRGNAGSFPGECYLDFPLSVIFVIPPSSLPHCLYFHL